MSFEDFKKTADRINGRRHNKDTKSISRQTSVRGLSAQDILAKARIDKGYKMATINDFKDINLEATMPNEKGIYIYGNCGVGKTHYSWGVYKRILVEKFLDNKDLGSPSMLQQAVDNYIHFVRSSFIMDKIYGTFEGKTKKEQVIAKYVRYPVLVIDDLMAQSPTDYYHECFLSIFDERLSGDKITIVTSNVNKEAISIKNERLGSRLKCLKTLYIGGTDRRRDE